MASIHCQHAALLLLMLTAAARSLAVAAQNSSGAPVPPDVAARWSQLDPKKWNLTALQAALPLLKAPPGFNVSIYYPYGLLNNARSLAVSGKSKSPGGPIITYVSTKLAKKVYALVDVNGDGVADNMTVLVDGIDTPQGIDWHKGDLYMSGWDGDVGMIWRLRDVDSYALAEKLYPITSLDVVSQRLPSDRHHGERYMRFGPDNLLYVSIGAPCNACKENSSPTGLLYASIYSLDVTAGNTTAYATDSDAVDDSYKLYARGLRNVVGMDWHPDKPQDFFFTENGRDSLGDNQPDCELNWANKPGGFFGFPECHNVGDGDPYLRKPGPGSPLPDPQMNLNNSAIDCNDPKSYQRPIQAEGPHTAPLGLRFYRWEQGRSWPRSYDRTLIVAQHGSWDRSSKTGYRLTLHRLANKTAPGQPPRMTAYEEFLTGFLVGERGAPKADQLTWGRPADVQQLPDGSLLVSDDAAHTVYRVRYTGPKRRR